MPSQAAPRHLSLRVEAVACTLLELGITFLRARASAWAFASAWAARTASACSSQTTTPSILGTDRPLRISKPHIAGA
eukprot:scaffold237040_cov21-Prasinocladus_malaysianus.AAC.2